MERIKSDAERGDAASQRLLGDCYGRGEGVPQDHVEAVKWLRKAAIQDDAIAQRLLGAFYAKGMGVPQDYVQATNWLRKAAEQGDAWAQAFLGYHYGNGEGVPQDFVEAHKWQNLASAQGVEIARGNLAFIARQMSQEQIAEAQRLAREFVPRKAQALGQSASSGDIAESRPSSTGSGFLITEDGFIITNEHVVREAGKVRVLTSAGLVAAKVVKVDEANDLALLKAEGRFLPLPVVASRGVRLGSTVATVGFPNIGMQGFAPKLAKGEIASLTGIQDDARHFQISVPVQPGNSGGALVDERGNVVGIVSAKLSANAALAATGSLPENVNYAVKSSFLLGFLESLPAAAAGIKEPTTQTRQFEEVAETATLAAVLVLVY